MLRTLNSHLAFRVSGILLLLLLCLTLQGLWVKELVNDKARSIQLTNAREHYVVVLADLERRWGLDAFNLKTRIEAQEILGGTVMRNEKLLAYLISQGSSLEFPSLRIEKTSGEVIASYDYTNHTDPTAKFLPGQVSNWVLDSSGEHLYLAIRQFIWLGKENGYLVLFKPMDHAMLTQMTYPGTRLSLWWKGQAIASSDGEDGLRNTVVAFPKPENSNSTIALTWSGPESENSPKLLVETLGSELIGTSTIARPVILVFFVLLIGISVSFSPIWIKSTRQLEALEQGYQRYNTLKSFDELVIQELRIAQSGPVKSVRSLANLLEKEMSTAHSGAIPPLVEDPTPKY
jgi:hypothetical protein